MDRSCFYCIWHHPPGTDGFFRQTISNVPNDAKSSRSRKPSSILNLPVCLCVRRCKHASKPWIEKCVCTNADVAVWVQDAGYSQLSWTLFSKWNDSIKGTMGILSPAMWQRFTLTRFPKLGCSGTGGKSALLPFFSSTLGSLCRQERPQRHMTWHALQSSLRALYLWKQRNTSSYGAREERWPSPL